MKNNGNNLMRFNINDQILEFYLQFEKHPTNFEVSKKEALDTMRFRLNMDNFDVIYEGHQNCSKTHYMNILSVFGDLHI